MNLLVTTDWLAAHLSDPKLRVVDGTFIVPPTTRDARAEYDAAHIPGAAFFDIDAIADHDTALPHMLPPAAQFAEQVGALGIGNDTWVVAYDTAGTTSAARVWWMLRAFGHRRVAVLDGGLARWRAEGRVLSNAPVSPAPRPFTAQLQPSLVRSLAQMRANVDAATEQAIDARPAGRFRGVDPEPRPGLRGGHIPGSVSIPSAELLDPQHRTLLPDAQLRQRFARAGIDLARPIVTTCGSGVAACVVALALQRLGVADVPVYDGSWTEWGGSADTPVATG